LYHSPLLSLARIMSAQGERTAIEMLFVRLKRQTPP
jgi:hypothetical protein